MMKMLSLSKHCFYIQVVQQKCNTNVFVGKGLPMSETHPVDRQNLIALAGGANSLKDRGTPVGQMGGLGNNRPGERGAPVGQMAGLGNNRPGDRQLGTAGEF